MVAFGSVVGGGFTGGDVDVAGDPVHTVQASFASKPYRSAKAAVYA